MATPTLSLVIPVYNESVNIDPVATDLIHYLDAHSWAYEIIFVNDGSTDDSEAKIKGLMEAHNNIRYLSFSRNFGKEAATSAGLKAAGGAAAIMYDADGQFPYQMIEEFVEAWKKGAEVVVGVRRSNQKEGMIKRYGSRFFYRILNMITDNQSVSGSTDFRLIDRKVIDAFNKLTERNRITRGLIDWLGFRRTYVKFDASPRTGGVPAYNFRRLMRLALHTFVAQSTRPLLFTGILGVLIMTLSGILELFMLIEKYALHDPLSLGLTGTAILAVFLTFLVGIVLSCQGLLALYVESIYSETQNRPLYVLREDD